MGAHVTTEERLVSRRRPVPRRVPTSERAGVVILGGSVWGVRVVSTVHELRLLAPHMRRLHAQSARPSPFTTVDFIESCARFNEYLAQPGSLELCVVCAFAGKELVGYLPMRRSVDHAGPIGYGKLALLSDDHGNRPVVRAGDETRVSAALVEYLLERDGSFAVLELNHQPMASPLLTRPMHAETHGFHVRRAPGVTLGSIHLRWPSLAAYVGDLDAEIRADAAKQLTSLLARDDLELIAARHPTDLEPFFSLYLDLEQRSGEGAEDISRNAQRVAFYRDLIVRSAPFELSFAILCAADQPIAGIINGRHGGEVFALQSACDGDIRDSGPSALLHLWSMQAAIESGASVYHPRHDSAYASARWLAEVTPTETLQLSRSRSAAHLKSRFDAARRWVTALSGPHESLVEQPLENVRPALPAMAHAVSRALVARCKHVPGAAVHGTRALATALPLAG